MWNYEYSVGVKASKQVIWQWWTAVEKWPQWDVDLSEAALLGEVAVGTQGRMKVADDALVSFVVSEVIPEERFAIEIPLFGARLTYTYTYTEGDNGLMLVHGAHIKGIFGFFWRLVLQKKIKMVLHAGLDAFALLVAEESAKQEEAAAQAAAAVPAPKNEEVPVEAVLPHASPEVAPVAEAAPAEAAAVEPTEEEKIIAAGGGDPAENKLREQDIHTQIEAAAAVDVPLPAELVESTAITFPALPSPADEPEKAAESEKKE